MIRYLLTVFLTFCLATLQSQNLEKSLLWKITGNGLQKPSYLYGTIHASCEVNFGANVTRALEQTSQLYLEIDMDDPTLQTAMIGEMKMKNGMTMRQLIDEKDFALLDDFLKENIGVSLQLVNSIKPFFVSAMLLPKLLDCEMKSVENELMFLAAAQGEEVYGLETVTEQMTIFDDIPYQEQINELVKTAKDKMANDKKEFKALLALYQTQDISALLSATEESENAMMSKFESELLTKRNKNWIPKIQKAMEDQPTFFAVGAAHLAGENGVIALLRKKGYAVTPEK